MKKTKGKHIAMLTPGFAANEEDTECIPALQDYIRCYQEEFPEDKISIITFHYPFETKNYNWFGVDVYSTGWKNKKGLYKLIIWIKVVLIFLKIHIKNPIDIIHSAWLHEATLIGQFLSSCLLIKHVATILGQDAKADNPFLPLLYFEGLTVVAETDFSASVFKESTDISVNYIIPFGLYSNNKQYIKDASREIDIIAVGSIIKIKNSSIVPDIIFQLKKKFPAISCSIIGERIDNHEAELIEQKINKLNLTQQIKLYGKLPRKDVFALMNKSKILLHTATYDAQPTVFTEALYFGASVVSFNVGHVYHPQLFICNDISQMINRITHLLEHEQSFNSKVIYSMQQTAQQYHDIYSA